MFIRNGWYVAAAAGEVGRPLLARWICGEPVVMFRKEDGTPVALEDRDVLESQQRMIETDPSGGTLLAINCDAGGVAARRIIDARVRAEAA